ncbi:MAG: SpoVG family protein [Planctomycetaceae bacterium]|jgi:stage V sporulation protein G|nr:SpoVG family protein [Planctomycetaceae bacterium]
MEITEVRIKLTDDPGDRLKAFCSITFDGCFVIRDLKIIDGPNGPFVAMPSRKLTGHCPRCRVKNHIRANYCNQCGAKLSAPAVQHYDAGRTKLYADIAHPINSACREQIQAAVIKSFEEEKIKALSPGYVSSYDDYNEEDFEYEQASSSFNVVHTDQNHKMQGPHKKDDAAPKTPQERQRNDQTAFGSGVFDVKE